MSYGNGDGRRGIPSGRHHCAEAANQQKREITGIAGGNN